ncbi:MAG: GGDEF domain-containing protein [Burkholderiaceae bacterium]|nr:GGDEF domain-containing protein [Burkholderiaceae bacterium]
MSTRRRSKRGERKLASLRLEIAKAEVRLAMLRVSIKEARSDAGLAAVHSARAENSHLLEKNLLAEQAACASQVALDLAVKASQTDALTGLRNRSVLWDRLAHEVELAGRHGHHVGVFLLDIDDFKQLNDQCGHLVGDLVLQWVAGALMATVRASDTVFRLGGDEFVVVALTVTRNDVDLLARKVMEALREPFCVAGQTISVSVSVGVAVFPEDGKVEEVLVTKADEAMYRIKRARSLEYTFGLRTMSATYDSA